MGRGLGWRAVRAAVLAAMVLAAAGSSSASARVLLVGTFHHHRGGFKTIQAAVDAAHKGDWILVAPGDYHDRADHRKKAGPQPSDSPAGVIIAKPGIHLRGMSRDRVVVDGTKPGHGRACSRSESRQDFGVPGEDKTPLDRNGILVYKASRVSVENLTVCNFLGGAGSAGNEIWWNGGDGSGKIGMGAFRGTYLNATSTYFKDTSTAAGYGLFSSNSKGPGLWDHTYASNFDDSDYYIGACAQVCNQTMNHAHAQYSALGYSGTNAGGKLLVENSEFDHNKDGFDTNSQNNDDAPSPQDGACPGTTRSCWTFVHNYVHDNNNPDVPGRGVAGSSPVGAGLTITGGRNDTVMNNRFEDNGGWGVLFIPFPDTDKPPKIAHCQGGVHMTGLGCLYDAWGNALTGNTFRHNGFFGNPTNADFGELSLTGPHPSNCFSGNVEAGGGEPTSSPPGLQASKPVCGRQADADTNTPLVNELICNTGLLTGACPAGSHYPRRKKVVMHPLPKGLTSMPDPCKGVPANPWCPRTG